MIPEFGFADNGLLLIRYFFWTVMASIRRLVYSAASIFKTAGESAQAHMQRGAEGATARKRSGK